jgi:hypothetical protein
MNLAWTRLARDYDRDLLIQDLEALNTFQYVSQPGAYHRGEWRGLSLHSSGGTMDWAGTRKSLFAPFSPTPALERTPYLRTILDEFEEKLTVRVLALPAGGRIETHTDDGMSRASGLLRLHVPIVTNPGVRFLIGGEECGPWRPGELWYGDFSQPHSVANTGASTRYHLVLDVVATDEVLALFPTEFVEAANRSSDPFPRPVVGPPAAVALERYECRFRLAPGALPGLPRVQDAQKTAELRSGFEGRIGLLNGELRVFLNDNPVFTLLPVGLDTFALLQLGRHLIVRFRLAGSTVAGAELVNLSTENKVELEVLAREP